MDMLQILESLKNLKSVQLEEIIVQCHKLKLQTKAHVSSISDSTSKQDLMNLFTELEPLFVQINNNHANIHFNTAKQAELAISKFNGKEFKGSVLSVVPFKIMKKRHNEPREESLTVVDESGPKVVNESGPKLPKNKSEVVVRPKK